MLISEEHREFIQGRKIIDNIIIAQEVLHSFQGVPQSKVLMMIKVDMKRAYKHVKWGYLSEVLNHYEFHSKFIKYTTSCVFDPTPYPLVWLDLRA